MTGRPPRLTEALLRRLLPPGVTGESILGDAREEWARRARTKGPTRAGLWYRGHALRMVITYTIPGLPKALGEGTTGMGRELWVALRGLRRYPGTAAAAVGVLALGIGLCAFMFSLVYGAFFRGLGLEDESAVRVLEIRFPAAGDRSTRIAARHYPLFEDHLDLADQVAAYTTSTSNLVWEEGAARLATTWITEGGLDLLGIPALRGRLIGPGDATGSGPLPVVLSHQAWQQHFDGDPGVLGTEVEIGGEAGTVVGIMPPPYRFPDTRDALVLLGPDRRAAQAETGERYVVFFRLPASTSLEAFHAQLQGLVPEIQRGAEDPPEIQLGTQSFVTQGIGPQARMVFTGMAGVVFLVLLVACANVANLLLARAASRTHEIGIRTALGGSRFRVVMPVLAEALVLAVAGGVLGTVLAAIGVGAMDRIVDPTLTGRPYFIRWRMDGPGLAFTLVLSLGTALLAGVFPAWRASSRSAVRSLRDGTRTIAGLGRVSQLLVAAEVAFSCAILVGAATMARSLVNLARFDLGFDPAPVLTGGLSLPEDRYPGPDEHMAFVDGFTRAMAAAPGVRSAAVTTILPGQGGGWTPVEVEGAPDVRAEDRPHLSRLRVSDGYFETLGAGVLRGRGFGPADRMGDLPVVVVDESAIRRVFDGQDPIDRRIRLGDDDTWWTVVGVVPDLLTRPLDPEALPGGVYVPLRQSPSTALSLMVRGGTDRPLELAPTLRDAVRELDPEVPLEGVMSLPDRIRQGSWFYTAFGPLFIYFGLAALFMAAVGLYAVLAFNVRRRTRELGVRVALGAPRRTVVRAVVRSSMVQVVAGLVPGLALGWASAGIVSTLSFYADPRDPGIFVAVALVLASVGLVAAWEPARRAAGVDPAKALRDE